MKKTENWRVRSYEQDLASQFSKQLTLPDVISQILVGRGFTSVQELSAYLSRSMSDLKGPTYLQGVELASKRISNAIRNQERIVIHGDFDADGITSTALLTRFLLDMGANVVPYIPNRLQENHGLSPKSIEVIEKEKAKLVITCDCGVSNAKEIEELHGKGIETIVTDHHSIPDVLPKSAIIVNPKLSEDSPEDLSGVGVAFMLVVAIRACLRDEGFFENRKEPNLREYLDIVALGTLADMAPLRGQNRILVHHGLKDEVEAPFATPCDRWEGGVSTTATTHNCSPKGFNMTHTHRRFPITDVEAGITAGFVNFNGGLPDVHMFKIRNGKIEEIQAVFGGNAQGAIWPDETK